MIILSEKTKRTLTLHIVSRFTDSADKVDVAAHSKSEKFCLKRNKMFFILFLLILLELLFTY